MVLNRNKIEKTYENVNLYNNNSRIIINRIYDATKLIYNTWKSYDTINWQKYQIKETDMRQKTASFTSNVNLDLTTGLYCVLISSAFHENFSGIILKKTFNEDTGLYDYSCQDWSRQYQSKFELITGNITIYRILQYLISRGGLPLKGKLTSKQLNNYKNVISGLLPAYLYDPAIWNNGKTSNPMNVKKKMIIRDTSVIDTIRDIVFGSGQYIDIYFNDHGTLQLKPFSKDDWLSGGLVLTTPEIMKREFSFDTTNILTNVVVNGSNGKLGNVLTSQELTGLNLSAFFGSLTGSVGNTSSSNTNTNVKTSTKTVSVKTTKKEGTGIHVFMNTDTINGVSSDKKLMNEIAKHLRKRGYTVTVGGVGSMTHYNDITKVKKNGIYFTLYGGRCAGTLKEQAYSNHYHSILKKRNARMVVGFYRRKLTDAWLPRAHDDNFSPSGFSGWDKPYTRLRNAGVGVAQGNTAKEIAAMFPNFKKNNPTATVTKTVKNTKSTASNDNFFNNLNLAKAKAREEIDKSVRDLMNLKITLPLGNPIFKNLHTNMFLWTVLPDTFQVANFGEIAKALNSTSARWSGYNLNRWYVEEVTINNNGKDGSIDVKVNPFASSISKYKDNRLKFESAYSNAVQNSNKNTSTTTTKKAVKTTKKVDIPKALDEVGKLMEKKKYARYTYSDYKNFVKYGKGDCWAGAYFMACQLQKRGVIARIIQYGTSQSDVHRSVQYKDAKGKWKDFPYRKYKIHSWFWNYKSSGKVIPNNCPKNI